MTLSISLLCYTQNTTPFEGKQIEFISEDSLIITADLYEIENKSAPVILLFHQAIFSRGEYIETAPKLNKLGYRCLAIDARSGMGVNGIKNESHKRAKSKNLNTKYIDALPDLEAALKYAKEEMKATKIILLGSSYSSALVLYLGSKYQNDIAGILSFSPGNYFEINDKSFDFYATKINCPVFITSAKNEQKDWQLIYDAVTGEKYFYLPETSGFHGSKALWSSKKGNELVWKEVETFLNSLK